MVEEKSHGYGHEEHGHEGERVSLIKRWLFTTNHKDVGIQYLVTSLFFFIVGGTLALLMRIQLSQPLNDFLDASAYNQAVTNHGLLMVLWFLSPLAFAFANYFVPIQIGARDMAFPRLNALSYWLLVFGGLLMIASFFTPGGAADFGWTIYAPLNTAVYTPQVGATLAGAGILMLIASVTVGTVNFIVTVARLRAKGLKWVSLPMFTWGIMFTVALMWIGFPSLLAGVTLLVFDRLFGTAFFLAPEGGSLLWDHLFWFFGHPEVYIVLLPAIGALADIIPVFSRKPLYAKKVFLGALATASILAVVVYAHHMFMTGINVVYREVHNITTEMISIPFGVVTIALIATMIGGAIRFSTPMLFALGSIAVFLIGGISGVFNSSVALDKGIRGSYWVVAHFHYVMVGASLFGLYAAFYYWFPKMTGRMYNEALGKAHFVLSMIGFNLLYGPMFFFAEMPRRIYTYLPDTGWGFWNMIATIGAFIFGPSQLIMFANFLYSLKYGEPAGNNPWGAWTYEWLTTSPPPEHNFEGTPVVEGNKLKVMPITADGGGNHHHVNAFSPWPFLISLGPFVAFLGLATSPLILAIGVVIFLIAAFGWLYDDYKGKFNLIEIVERDNDKDKETWPFSGIHRVTLGMWVFITGDFVFFTGLFGAYIFLRANSSWWPSGLELHNPIFGVAAVTAMLASAAAFYAAISSAKKGDLTATRVALVVSIIAAVGFVLFTVFEYADLMFRGFTINSPILAIQSFFAVSLVHLAHVIAGIALLFFFLAKALSNRIYVGHTITSMKAFMIYWGFLAAISVAMFQAFYII